MLQTSFQLVQDSNQDFPAAFYGHLFADYPEVRPLFANTAMDQQGDHLLKSLKFVVANLRDSEQLTNALRGLGTRHVSYGVLPKHYPMVGSSLLKTLANLAGEAWTPEVKQAWVDAYAVITTVMLEGADYSIESVQLSDIDP